MRPSKGAGRPSLLAMNPRNREASAARRTKLLAAFDALDEDTRADLLEAVETMASRLTSGLGRTHPSALSTLTCTAPGCGRIWRTDAAYVETLRKQQGGTT
jgi:hypothetical protein